MSIAAQIAARPGFRRRRPSAAPGQGVPGVPILAQQFGTRLHLAVEAAFGADTTQDDTVWPWVDVTSDVQYDGKVNITIGGTDEASTTQPANMTVTLDNRTGAYSKGPQGSHYPYVGKGVPVRVRTFLDGVPTLRFQGRAVGFSPSWDVTGNYAVAVLTAAGALRRISQGQTPVQSVLTRSIPTLTDLEAYWPCEDGASAVYLASGMASGGYPMFITGTPTLAAFSGFAASNPIPTLGSDSWSGQVRQYTSTGTGQIKFLYYAPASTVPDQSRLVSIATAGVVQRIDVLYALGGGLRVEAYGSGGALLADSGNVVFDLDGQYSEFLVRWSPDGSGNTDVLLAVLGITDNINDYFINSTGITVNGATCLNATRITVNPDGKAAGASIGQLFLENSANVEPVIQVFAYEGESPTDRIARLCAEQGESVTVTGSSEQAMGPQAVDTFLNLMRAAELTDGGILYDGAGDGFAYIWRQFKENQTPALTLDASLGQVAFPVLPVDDDRLTVNGYQATQLDGSVATFTDTTDSFSFAAIGDYSQSGTVGIQNPVDLQNFAAWQVHLGTVDEYRYPTVTLLIHRNPEILSGWLQVTPATHIDVINFSDVRTQQEDVVIQLLAEGWSEVIDQFTWTVGPLNCSPYSPWWIAQIAAPTGDTNPLAWRLDTDGAQTVGDAPVGSTALTVATPSGPLWTTVADDFPFYASVGGVQVQVTNITGAASPQVFTVAATGFHFPPGTAVSLWAPPVLSR